MKKILIVEDEQSLLKLLELTFKSSGYEVLKAINSEETYAALSQTPDIILLDILLPGENGLSILEHIKKDQKTKTIPIIMLTNFNEPERIEKAKKLGIEKVAFDRSGLKYHGRVKALADAARENGLKF